MSSIWMSSLFSSPRIGGKQGLRSKFFGHDWQPAEFKIPPTPDEVYEAMRRYARGFALNGSELPEAAAVWDEGSFRKVGDIFTAGGGMYVVRNKYAEILSRFDLGDGGLVPFPIYKADLETPYPCEFFLLNFGARKNTVLPEQSQNVAKLAVEKATGIQFWKVNSWVEDDEVAVSERARDGADLWAEEILYNKLFMSQRLADALQEAGLAEDWLLKRCRVVEASA